MPKSATPIFLSNDDKSYLKSILQKGTVEARVHRRAKILLLKSDGMADEAIADKLDISRPTVKLCLKKYMESGVKAAMEDSKGRGRRIEITDDAKAWVINIACQKPSAFGLPAELWYPLSLTRYINSVAEQEDIPVWRQHLSFLSGRYLGKQCLIPIRSPIIVKNGILTLKRRCMMCWSFTNRLNSALMKMEV